MTTESASLLPSLSNRIACWLLLVIASLCLPTWGQAVAPKTIQSTHSAQTGKTPPQAPSPRLQTKQTSLPSLPVGIDSNKTSYIVGPEDAITIEVYDNPDLKGEYTVSTDGDIVFPLIGQVQVSGKTVAAIKNELTRLLEKDYLFNPIVSVAVSKYLSKKIKIMGNVGKPGVYYLDRPTRLFELLTKAEGISKQLGRTVMSGQKAHIMRATSETKKIITYYIDLHQLLVEGKDEANIYLQPDDVIYIPDTRSFQIIGEVKNSGSFPFEEGLTLFKAIALAGGLTPKGSSDTAIIKRMNEGRLIEMKGKMDTILQPDDTIFIPEVRSFHVVGEVIHPGSFPYEPRLTLLKAIAMAGGPTKKAAPKDSVIKRTMKDGKLEKIEAAMNSLILPEDVIEVPLSFW